MIAEALLAYLMGLASIVSPCTLFVLPVVASKVSKRDDLLRFSTGLLASFSLVGVLSAAFGVLVTVFFGGLVFWVAGVITLLSGYHMLGLIELNIPTPNIKTEGMGSMALGVVFGLISLTCIGPYIAPIVAYIISQASAVVGAALMLFYGAGFLTPFLFINYLLKDRLDLKDIGKLSSKAKTAVGYLLVGFATVLFLIPQM